MDILVWYILAISLIAVILTAYDKAIAGSKRRRIPEKTLFLAAALGGSAAMYITMRIIRHKTLHKRFMLGLPAMIIVQTVLLWWLLPQIG